MIGTEELLDIDPDEEPEVVQYTAEKVGRKLRTKISGYKEKVVNISKVFIIGLDSASKDKGRLSITFFNEMDSVEYWNNIEHWHTECVWWLWDNRNKLWYVGAPSPKTIVEVAYGKSVDEKLRKKTVARLLPCIIERRPLPPDLVEACIHRACNRNGLESWDWTLAINTACALFRYQFNSIKQQHYNMSLDTKLQNGDICSEDYSPWRNYWKNRSASFLRYGTPHQCGETDAAFQFPSTFNVANFEYSTGTIPPNTY